MEEGEKNSHKYVFTNEKAGMGGVDKKHVARVVHEASKGSKFYEHASKQDAKV